MGAVFAKTPKGHAELTGKVCGLTPRQRRALIMVNGKRTVDDLRDMLHADDLQHTLGLLEEIGLIQIAAKVDGDKRKAVDGKTVLPSITAFQKLPAEHDPVRLQQARNFMMNTLNAFVGGLGASSLLERIERAESHASLRKLYGEWYHAIVMTRDGRREAEVLRGNLLKVI
jgi:hypothetical protein